MLFVRLDARDPAAWSRAFTPDELLVIGSAWDVIEAEQGIAWRVEDEWIHFRGAAEKRACALQSAGVHYATRDDHLFSWPPGTSRRSGKFLTGEQKFPAPLSPQIVTIWTTHACDYARAVQSEVWRIDYRGG